MRFRDGERGSGCKQKCKGGDIKQDELYINMQFLTHFSFKFRAVSPRPLPFPTDVNVKTAQSCAEEHIAKMSVSAISAKTGQDAIAKVSSKRGLTVFLSLIASEQAVSGARVQRVKKCIVASYMKVQSAIQLVLEEMLLC